MNEAVIERGGIASASGEIVLDGHDAERARLFAALRKSSARLAGDTVAQLA